MCSKYQHEQQTRQSSWYSSKETLWCCSSLLSHPDLFAFDAKYIKSCYSHLRLPPKSFWCQKCVSCNLIVTSKRLNNINIDVVAPCTSKNIVKQKITGGHLKNVFSYAPFCKWFSNQAVQPCILKQNLKEARLLL